MCCDHLSCQLQSDQALVEVLAGWLIMLGDPHSPKCFLLDLLSQLINGLPHLDISNLTLIVYWH